MEEQFKYLAIKNWERFQMTDRKGRDIKLYIKDYCAKDMDDHDYAGLTFLQRYIWDACCRLRGRIGRNLFNDPVWIGRAIGAIPKERHYVPAAISKLISCGFLILTNEEVSPSDSKSEKVAPSSSDTDTHESREEESREEESRDETVEADASPAGLDFSEAPEEVRDFLLLWCQLAGKDNRLPLNPFIPVAIEILSELGGGKGAVAHALRLWDYNRTHKRGKHKFRYLAGLLAAIKSEDENNLDSQFGDCAVEPCLFCKKLPANRRVDELIEGYIEQPSPGPAAPLPTKTVSGVMNELEHVKGFDVEEAEL